MNLIEVPLLSKEWDYVKNVFLRRSIVCLILTLLFIIRSSSLCSASNSSERDSAYMNMRLFTRVMEIIRQHYVETNKTEYQELTYGALRGMLSSLDPHSQFMDPGSFAAMREETEGQFGGLGLTVSEKDGRIVIISPIEGTPGAKAGLQPKDIILRVDGKTVERMGQGDVAKKLRGPPGSKVTLTIFRPDLNEIQDYTLERAIIKIDSVKDVKLLTSDRIGAEKIGYLRIIQFNEPTDKEFEQALETLEKQGISALIIDLRNNPGGLLDTAAEVAGKFIPAGEVIVTTEGRSVENRSIIRSMNEPKHDNYPLAVLVNSGSASGAEIVAGALKDLKKAVIIGETTFGKGSVQSVLPLSDNSAIRLTTAKYYTPSHQMIHEKGIEPNIIVSMSREEEHKLFRMRSGLILNDYKKEEMENVQDAQLERAIEALCAIRIYVQRNTAIATSRTAAK